MFLADTMKRHTMKRPTRATPSVVFGRLMISIFTVSVPKCGAMMSMHALGSFMNILVTQFKLLTKKKI